MLEIGSKFAGYTIQDKRDGEVGQTVLFVYGNEGVYVTIPYEDLFSAIASPVERERIEDHLAAALYTAFKEKSSGIWSK